MEIQMKRITFLKIILAFTTLLSLVATLMHGFYFDISMFHALILHPIFLIIIMLILVWIEQYLKISKKK